MNLLPLLNNEIAPSEAVETITRSKPNNIVFLEPILFFIFEFIGEKITCASENEAIIQPISVSDISVSPSHVYHLTKVGKNATKLVTIMLPIKL